MMGFLARGNGAIENKDAHFAVACGCNRVRGSKKLENLPASDWILSVCAKVSLIQDSA